MTNREDGSPDRPGANYIPLNKTVGFFAVKGDPQPGGFDAGDLSRVHDVVEQNQAFRGIHYLGSEFTRLTIYPIREFGRSVINLAAKYHKTSPAPGIPPLRIDGHFGIDSVNPEQNTQRLDND